jgi:Hsp20/alpha crystallin family
MEHQLQTIPVRIYDRDEHIILAAPMPGLEPENISIEIAGTKVTIKGEERGPRQHSADVIVDEWTIGPWLFTSLDPVRVPQLFRCRQRGAGRAWKVPTHSRSLRQMWLRSQLDTTSRLWLNQPSIKSHPVPSWTR